MQVTGVQGDRNTGEGVLQAAADWNDRKKAAGSWVTGTKQEGHVWQIQGDRDTSDRCYR